jgi:hypothetical protein
MTGVRSSKAFIVVVITLALRLGLVSNIDADAAAEDISFIVDRLAGLQHVQVHYTLTEQYAAPPVDGPAAELLEKISSEYKTQGVRMELPAEERKSQCVYRHLRGTVKHEKDVLQDGTMAAGLPTVQREVLATSHGRYEQLLHMSPSDRIQGSIRNESWPIATTLEMGLGLRAFDSPGVMSSETYSELQQRSFDDGKLVLCRQDANDIKHVWTFDMSQGAALTSYVVSRKGFDFLEVTCDEFEDVDGVVLPKKIRNMRFSKARAGSLERGALWIETVHVEEYQLNDPLLSDEEMYIVFPVGTRVHDARHKHTFRVADEPQSFPDEVILASLGVSDEPIGSGSRGWYLALNVGVVVVLVAIIWLRKRA